MESPNPLSSEPVDVDQRPLQFSPVDLPLTPSMVDASPDVIVDITSLTEVSTGEKRKREGRLRSKVWQHFIKLIKEDGTCDKCKCNHCHKLFTCSARSGTTHLLRHISEGICPAFKKVKRENPQALFNYMRGNIQFDQELNQASIEQSTDTHDDILQVGLETIESQAFTTPKGAQTSIPKLPQQPGMKSQPISVSWMSELRTCVGKLVDLTGKRGVSKTCEAAATSPDLSITSAVKCLNEMEDIPQSSGMYLDALDVIRNPDDREYFVCLNPEPRRRWLQRMLHRRFPLRYADV